MVPSSLVAAAQLAVSVRPVVAVWVTLTAALAWAQRPMRVLREQAAAWLASAVLA